MLFSDCFFDEIYKKIQHCWIFKIQGFMLVYCLIYLRELEANANKGHHYSIHIHAGFSQPSIKIATIICYFRLWKITASCLRYFNE